MTITTPTRAHVDAVRTACDFPGCDHKFCVPQDVTPLAAYALVVTASHDALDGVYWEGDLYRDGDKVLVVGNEGRGGPNTYLARHDLPLAAYAREMDEFGYAARAAFPTVRYEAEDIAVGFLDLVQQIGPL
jgi:hypothetical protein